MPVAILVMKIMLLGVWPDSWREHWVIPLFKRGATYAANNYRGIHLTAQLSKVVERMVKKMIEPFLERILRTGQINSPIARNVVRGMLLPCLP